MRTLNRPMFRLGGPANEGITSGLAPRKGYSNGDLVKKAQEDKVMALWGADGEVEEDE